MACISPITLKDGDVVPCGACKFCKQLRRMDWCFRLAEEQRVCYSSHFLTLTYSEEFLPSGGNLRKEDAQKFLKMVRRFQEKQYDGLVPVRFYLVGEYGELYQRPHYHLIIFNLIPRTVLELERLWSRGCVHVGTVSDQSIGYVTSYVLTKEIQPGREPPFCTMSRRPGIGAVYLSPLMVEFHQDGMIDHVARNSRKFHMPRYYRDKLFTKEQKLELRRAQLQQLEADYDRTIEKLRRFHPDPYFYYEERRRVACDTIGSRLVFQF